MRIVKRNVLLLIVFVCGILEVTAQPPPPPPPGTDPPIVPIDDNIHIFLIIALLLGLYIIYNHKLKTKTPT